MAITFIALLFIVGLAYYLRWRSQNAQPSNDSDRAEAMPEISRLERISYNNVFGQIAHMENKLLNDIPLSEAEIRQAVDKPETRYYFYEMLEAYEKTALFPEPFFNEVSSAESQMVYWLLHEKALGSQPNEIELAQTVQHTDEEGSYTYYAFKFRTNAPHPASDTGWMLGVSGPFRQSKSPYRCAIATFSKLEPFFEEQVEPLVAWTHEQIKQHVLTLSKS